MTKRNGRGFVPVHRDAFPRFCRENDLSLRDQRVLAHLVAEADYETGIVNNFTLTKCAGELGLGTSSGRRTLSQTLERLRLRGVICYQPFAGRLPGTVAIPTYRRLTTGIDEADSSPRAETRETRGETSTPPRRRHAKSARRGARKARAETPKSALPPAETRTEEVPLEVDQNLASEQGGSAKDWKDEELDELVEPIVDFCRRFNKLGMDHRAGVLAALSPYSRDQVENLVDAVLDTVTKDDRLTRPIGVLVARARIGAAEDLAPRPKRRRANGFDVAPTDDELVPFEPPDGLLGAKLASVRGGR